MGGIKKRLARKIVIASLLTCCFAVVFVVIFEYARIKRDAFDAVAEDVKDIVSSISDFQINNEGVSDFSISDKLKSLLPPNREYPYGHFEYLNFRLSNANSNAIEATTGDYAGIAAKQAIFSRKDELSFLVDYILDGEFYIAFEKHIETAAGRVGRLTGVYHIKDAYIHGAINESLFIVFAFIVLAFIISIIHYSMIKHLVLFQAKSNVELLDVLGRTIALRDNETYHHNLRVVIYSTRIAERMKLPTSFIKNLIKGALLHDIGKIGTPDAVLLKPGKLDAHEFEIIKKHVIKGISIIESSDTLSDSRHVILYHHEKYSGGGYVFGLSNSEIPLAARIFAVADVFDALTSDRPYKRALNYEDVMRIMADDVQTHFDPEVWEAFKDISEDMFNFCANRNDDVPVNAARGILDDYFIGTKRSKISRA